LVSRRGSKKVLYPCSSVANGNQKVEAVIIGIIVVAGKSDRIHLLQAVQ